jgi:hypothetical protein
MHGMALSSRGLPALAVVAAVALIATPGCTRHHFRNRADKDVEGIITQKNVFPDWQVKNWNVYPNPRARFADQSNPDRPPYPPDDPAARVLSPNPQRPTKKSGVGRVDGDGYLAMLQQWDAENRAADGNPPAPGMAKGQNTPNVTQTANASKFAPPQTANATPQPELAPQPNTMVAQAHVQPSPAALPPTRPRAIPAPTVIQGDRPAVKHTFPPDTPAALRPASGTSPAAPSQPVFHAHQPQPFAPAQNPHQPAGVHPTQGQPGEFGPWVPVRPSMPGPVVIDRGNGPSITELRAPTVIVASGEVEEKGPPKPVMEVIPVQFVPDAPGGVQPAAQPAPTQPKPEPIPQPQPIIPLPIVIPDPMPVQPGQPMPMQPQAVQPVPPAPPVAPLPPPMPLQPKPGDPVGMGGDGLPATGDPAADYLKALDSGQTGYRIRFEQAMELALLNAREFQDRREDLYLAALPVTLSRYNFAAQAFFMERIIRESTGRDLANPGERWRLNTTTGLSKLFPTGALLLVQLANQVVIDLSGDKPQTSVSNLTLSLAQPFLRGGGYAVTLEDLTQTERTLLYAMRSYARFRKVFYVAISAGGDYTNNPYGLQGLSTNLGRGIGNNLTAPSVGYLQLLQLQAIINNQRRNVAALERLLRLYQAFREGGQQSPLQVGQVEVQLLNSRGNLLGSGAGNSNGIRGYLDALDNYKLQLGLPMTVPLELDDAPLRPIREQLARFDELFAQARALGIDGAEYNRTEPVAEFRKRWLKLFTASPLVRGTAFAKEIEGRWATWAPNKLTEDQARKRLSDLREERRKLLAERVDREVKKLPEPPGEVARLDRLSADIELGEFELRVRAYEAQPWAKKEGKERESLQDNAFNSAFNAFYLVALGAQNERLTRLYQTWPELLPLPMGGVNALESSLDEAYTAGIQTALINRLDLMNARAQVVDAWRQIAVTANSLQGVFDVRYDLNSNTPAGGNNPFAFSGTRSNHQLTFRAELPLIRRAERNNYRAALVAYQRQRRTLMAFEDNIANDVRRDLRQLRTLAELYRIQKRAVELGYAQVDNAEAVLFAPPVPGAGSDAGSAAALTQQVLTAQSTLLTAQNNLYTIWIQYLSARMNLYLDLEQMQLDDRGVWCDEFSNRIDSQNRPDARPLGERLHPPRLAPDGNNGGQER